MAPEYLLGPDHQLRADHEPRLQFVAVLAVPQGDPHAVADDLVRELCDGDPRRQDRLAGGSRGIAERYGFRWPPPAPRRR